MIRNLFLPILISGMVMYCCVRQGTGPSLINTAHLDHLYEPIVYEGRPAAIIHIYADYPEYHRTGAPGEGIACVDDIARAAVFYLRHIQAEKDSSSLEKAQRLIRMLLMMQHENGYFFNFLDEHYRIEKNTVNSQPSGNWWSWRALWAIGEGYAFWQKRDAELADELRKALSRGFLNIREMVSSYPDSILEEGCYYPSWLPLNYAADQAAVIMLAALPYYEATGDTSIIGIMDKLGKGMMRMRAGDADHFPFGAFLSWPGLWHAYGNNQADVLLKAWPVVHDEEFKTAALQEIDRFYPWLMETGYQNVMRFAMQDGSYVMVEKEQYAQIAYGIRPMVWAALSACTVTGDDNYAVLAADIAGWLLGKNATGQLIYDPATGRCFDGIDSPAERNYSAGAESTIEALLTILEAEKNPVTRIRLHDYYEKRKAR